MAAKLAEQDPSWSPAKAPLELTNDLSWKPDLATEAGAVLHVQLTGRLPRHMVTRLKAAASHGHSIHVALPIQALWHEETVLCLSEADAHIHVLDADGLTRSSEPILDALTKAEVPLASAWTQQIARAAWDRCAKAATNEEKGHRLEMFLAFLLGQSRELRVVERNLRTETEEIDIVAQPSVSGLVRCWAILGSPFLLFEAKNWSDPVGKPQVSDMLGKIRGYRGTVKVGILVGANGFTQDARNHELRYAAEEGTIAFVGPKEIEKWITAPDLDDYFESLIRKAMLR